MTLEVFRKKISPFTEVKQNLRETDLKNGFAAGVLEKFKRGCSEDTNIEKK